MLVKDLFIVLIRFKSNVVLLKRYLSESLYLCCYVVFVIVDVFNVLILYGCFNKCIYYFVCVNF